MRRRTLLSTIGAVAAGSIGPRARAATVVGVTATELKIGHTCPYSGPASAYSALGKLHVAFFKRVNDQGGVGGRKVNFITYDDAYTPSKMVEQVRRLVEQDQVACLFNTLGTPTNTAIHKYCNDRKVPQLFVATGADKWGDPQHFPWTIGWQPSYRTEAQIYAKYILAQHPNPKIAVMYQNDDFGKDYLTGLKEVFGANYSKYVVKETSYEVTDATVDSQTVSMKDSGADVLVGVATPKFAAQLVRKVYDLSWKPLFVMTNVGISVGAVMEPAGPEKSIGMISSLYLKDSTDHAYDNDAGMNEWRAFMKQYLPDADVTDGGYIAAYGAAQTMHQVLKQCGDDFSRENLMKQAANIKDLVCGTVLNGIKINTSPTNFHPIQQLQLAKWTGKTWERFGDVMSGASV